MRIAAAVRRLAHGWSQIAGPSARLHAGTPITVPLQGPAGRDLVIVPGRPLALVVSDAAVARLLEDALIGEGLARGSVWAVCTDHCPPQSASARTLRAWREGNLRLLGWRAEGLAGWRRFWTPPVWRELKTQGLRPADLVLMQPWPFLSQALASSQADPTIVAKAAGWLRAWASQHDGEVVLLAVGARQAAAGLSRAGLPEVLYLHGDADHLSLERLGPADPSADHGRKGIEVQLRLPDSTAVARAGPTEGLAGAATADPLPSYSLRVVTTASVVAQQTGVPGTWTVVEDLDAVSGAAVEPGVRAVVLPYDGYDCLPRLAHCLQALRAARPEGLKILVREVSGKLRYPQELALLRLGAVAVIYREIGFSRLLQQVESLPERLASTAPAQPAEQVLESVTPDAPHGYLPLGEFCATVGRLLERTSAVSLSHCLVQLPLLPDVPHVDALIACHLSRAGDLVSTEGGNVWLFLFGCREPDVMPTLGRVFSLPPSVLFEHVSVDADPQSMAQALEGLADAALQSPADFSAVLAAQSRPAKPADDGPVVDARAPVAAVTDSLHWLPLPRSQRPVSDAGPVVPRPRQLRAQPLPMKDATPA